MTFLLLVELTVAYVQYMYILLYTSPLNFPSFYIEPFYNLRFLFFDFIKSLNEASRYQNGLDIELPKWIPMDYRLRFIFVSVILPLLVSLFGIFLLCSPIAFLWIFFTFVGLFSALSGLFLLYDPHLQSVITISPQLRLAILIIGAAVTFILTVIGFGYSCLSWRRNRKKEDAILRRAMEDESSPSSADSFIKRAVFRFRVNWRAIAALRVFEEKQKHYTRRHSFKYNVLLAILIFVTALAGVLLYGLIPIKLFGKFKGSSLGHFIGGSLICVSCVLFVWAILGIFSRGRQIQLCIHSVLFRVFVCVILLLLSAIYNPVLMHLIGIVWCTQTTCNVGERQLPPNSIAKFQDTNLSWFTAEKVCQSCDFTKYQQNCPSNLQEKFCETRSVQWRLVFDVAVPCDEINFYYKVTAAVVMFAYIVSYPSFLVIVANRGSKILEKEFPLDKRICEEFNDKELYYEKTKKSRNVAASIYSGYKRSHRFAQVVFLFYRVILVLISSLTHHGQNGSKPYIGMSLIISVSFFCFIYIAIFRPFARPVGNIYGASHQLMLIAVGTIGVFTSIFGKEKIYPFFTILVAVLIFFAPLTALIIGLFLTFREDLQRSKRLQQRLEKAFVFLSKNTQSKKSNDDGNDNGGGSARKRITSTPNNNNNNNKGHKMNRKSSFVSINDSVDSNKNSGNKLFNRKKKNSLLIQREGEKVKNPLVVGYEEEISPYTSKLPARHELAADVKRGKRGVVRTNPPYPEDTENDKLRGSFGDFSSFRNENNEFEEVQDDYFCDKRVFLPGAYFRGFSDVPVVTRKEEDDDEDGEDEENKKDGKDNTIIGAALKSTIIPLINKSMSIFMQRKGTKKSESEEEKSSSTLLQGNICKNKMTNTKQNNKNKNQKAKNNTTHKHKECEGQGVGNNNNKAGGDASTLEPAMGKFIGWCKHWKKLLLLGTTPLRYEDVLVRREELEKSIGISQRPFWLEPSECQKHAYNTVGNSLPCSRINKNFMRALLLTRGGKETLLASIKEVKNTLYPSLVVPRNTAFDDNGATPNENDMVFASNSVTSSAAYVDSENASTILLLAKRSTTSNNNNNNFNERQKHNQELLTGSKMSYVTRNPKLSAEEPLPYGLAPLQSLYTDAQRKLEHLKLCCPRRLQARFQPTQHLSNFGPVIPNVCLEGIDVENWDDVLKDVIEEITQRQSKSSTTGRKMSVASSTEGKSGQEQERQRRGSNDSKKKKRRGSRAMSTSSAAASAAAARENLRENTFATTNTNKETSRENKVTLTEKQNNSEAFFSRRVPLLKRYFILRCHLFLAFKKQREELHLFQKAVDFSIAKTVKKYMHLFFIFGGILTTVALLLCLRGMLDKRDGRFVGGIRNTDSVEYQLMGYNNWENFTRHCCCLSIVNLTGVYPYYAFDVEDWLCDDGRIKQRVRRNARRGEVVNGYRVRGLCGMTFNNGCQLTVTDENTVKLTGCEKSITEEEKNAW